MARFYSPETPVYVKSYFRFRHGKREYIENYWRRRPHR